MTIEAARKQLDALNDVEPSSMDEALKHIEAIKDAMNDALDTFERREGELEDEVRDAEHKATIAKDKAENALFEYAEELCRVHQKLKAGRHDDAAHDLYRVIQDADPGSKARTSAVAVML